jgi:hypothetical protein
VFSYLLYVDRTHSILREHFWHTASSVTPLCSFAFAFACACACACACTCANFGEGVVASSHRGDKDRESVWCGKETESGGECASEFVRAPPGVCVGVYRHICTCKYMCVCERESVCVHIHIYRCAYLRMYVCLYTRIHA